MKVGDLVYWTMVGTISSILGHDCVPVSGIVTGFRNEEGKTEEAEILCASGQTAWYPKKDLEVISES